MLMLFLQEHLITLLETLHKLQQQPFKQAGQKRSLHLTIWWSSTQSASSKVRKTNIFLGEIVATRAATVRLIRLKCVVFVV
jgi:hypothetical protein